MDTCTCSGRLLRIVSPRKPFAGQPLLNQNRMPCATGHHRLQRAPWRHRPVHARAEGEPSTSSEPEGGLEDDDLLLPEEDWVVPGGYQDTLSKNTKLGRAVDDACKELETLGQLEAESLSKANALLKQLGYRGDITAPRPQQDPE